MPLVNQSLRTAIKGLITERQELVFPEDASVDELNCHLLTDGTRRRRKSIKYEDNNSLSSFTLSSGAFIQEDTWLNVGGVASLEFLVIQINDTLRFYDKSSDPVSANEKSFTVNLNTFSANNGVSVNTNSFQGASLDGVFVVVHPGCNSFYITYDVDTDSISTTQITHQIRDFEWQGDTSTYFEKEATPVSVERDYDTKNAGWIVIPDGDDPLQAYITNEASYPALTHPWFSGKNSKDEFDAENWENIYSGTSLTGNGHYILNYFSRDRETIVPGMGVEVESSRFRTVEAYAGRFWYAGLASEKNSGQILFTKIIERREDYGVCYQVNDPTSEDISDLLDSDGGVINIPDAYGISKLYSFGPTLLVFADNGVWVIKGIDDVFKSTEYSISKVTSVGLLNPNTFVDGDGTPFWWSKYGVHTVGRSEISQNPQEVSLSEDTIQEFWENIDTDKKLEAKGIYDPFDKVIYWIYPSNDEVVNNKYNKLLLLDIQLKAFVPWEIADQSTNTNYVVGISFFNPLGSLSQTEDVEADGDTVTVAADTVVVSEFRSVSSRDSVLKLIVRDGDSGKLTFALFDGTDFLDWGESNYSSYVELGYSFFESLTTKKTPMFITTYFNVTETGFSDNGDGSFSLVNPSSCKLKVFWDFRDTPSSTQSVYRLKRMPVVDENNLDEFDYGQSVLVNRTRIKGRGRVMQLRFESEQGKDFSFLGYEMYGFMNEGL